MQKRWYFYLSEYENSLSNNQTQQSKPFYMIDLDRASWKQGTPLSSYRNPLPFVTDLNDLTDLTYFIDPLDLMM